MIEFLSDIQPKLGWVIIGAIVLLIVHTMLASRRKNLNDAEIKSDPVPIDATIVAIIPGTPSQHGFVSISVDYSFVTPDGQFFEKKNASTSIKTMELQNFQVGNNIAVLYLRTEPSKNMLGMESAVDVWAEKRWNELMSKLRFWK